jgi:RNA polymerase sigma-70 factor (ECF subfamily)
MRELEVNQTPRTDWEAVYRKESPVLWRSLMLQTGSQEIASDAVAEAFAQAISRGEALKKPGAWVWKTAFMIAKGESSRQRVNLPALPVIEAGISEQVMDLIRGLQTLTPMQRAATVLHYFAGYSVSETAAMLGSTRSAVGVHLHRARSRLRTELEDER